MGYYVGIEENPLQHQLLCAPAELDRDEWKLILQPDFQEAARVPAQWTSSISTVSHVRHVERRYAFPTRTSGTKGSEVAEPRASSERGRPFWYTGMLSSLA